MTLVCIPGSLCDERVFGPLLDRLQRPAVCMPPIDAPTIADAADAVLSRAPARFVPVGFSLGGFVALELLRRAPERVMGVVLLSSHAHPDTPAAAPDRRAQADLARTAGLDALIDTLWPRYVGPASVENGPLRGLILEMAHAVGPARFARQVELNINRPDSRRLIAETTKPLLVIYGAEDALCPKAYATAAAESPTATFALTPGAGHFTLLEAPEAVAGVIRAWWDGLPSSSRPLRPLGAEGAACL